MEADTRNVLLALLFLCCATTPLVLAQGQARTRCSYMNDIPRPPTPDLPPLEYDGLTWSQRPLIPAPEREDLCMDEYEEGTQVIYIEEEIEGEIPIARLNYHGPLTPYIPQFISGARNMLGPDFRRLDDGYWYLYITQRQDYESGNTRYVFQVRVDDESSVPFVTIEIVNIDDNAPVISLATPCLVAELGEPRLTDCIYEVYDADGQISTTAMTFTIESDREEDEDIFFIDSVILPNQWFVMNMTLGLSRTLDFEASSLHILTVTAFDSLPNSRSATLIIQVENVEHRPPRWLEIFAVQQFDEKTLQNFTFRAIDGDTGINKPIHYSLIRSPNDTFFSIETIEGGRSGGILHVDIIDRDELEQDIFQLSIVAYKYDNASFSTTANVVIIVNDVNDQIPEPLHDSYFIEIMEETALTLNFGEQEFGFHDKDLGEHARYSVHLESVFPPGAEEAFYISPEIGYQRQTFIMGTSNHSMLDYEVEDFQNITIRVIATDLDKPEHVGVAMLYINLINWNDELPIFEHNTQVVSFDETEGADFYVATVRANDRDIGDRVEHSLMGNAAEFLRIDDFTGEIYVSIDNAFDYHRQNQLFVQVRADDTLMAPYNTATSQLVINLLDINNTPPTLRLPRESPRVEENVPEGYVIDENILATDPDTTALLVFEIDWNTTYATKQGRETDPAEYMGCVEIETVYENENNTGRAYGRVVVKTVRPGVTIDFEEFEVLYLTVRVRDLRTVLNEDSDLSTFTIVILDMNDNPPVWVEGTLEAEFRVREMSGTDIVIGSVLATDIDGPQYNQVRYTIFPNGETPEDLVKIDFYTGQITVDTAGAIDADIPPRFYLTYTIIASDRCYAEDIADCPPDPYFWDTEGNITIYIIDTNNKVPMAEETLLTTVYIYENATTGDEVVLLVSSDLDRDEIYNTVRYQINYAVNNRLRDFFSVDLDTGLIYVDYTTEETLDRDGDEPTHQIFLNLIDNFFSDGDGNRNQNTKEVLVVLLDVNDNAPELPTPDRLTWSISENLLEGTRVLPEIYAPDRDEPNTDNSRVGYAILDLTITNRDIEVPELFVMIQIQNVTGELETAMDLRGYWGTYNIHIEAYDHGIPQQKSNETYVLVINPYNFNAPVYVFPEQSSTIRLRRESLTINGVLFKVDNEVLESIYATDEDGLEAGIVDFQVIGDNEAVEYFAIQEDIRDNYGTLTLIRLFDETVRQFQVTIRATDRGTNPAALSTDVTITVVFVPTQADPVFNITTANVAFFEKEGGLEQSFPLPLAEDPKNYLCTDDCYDIYYTIIEGNDDGYFVLNQVTNVISLDMALDREEGLTHSLVVAASNTPGGGTGLATSRLSVTVTVREANPRPTFLRDLYMAGISTLDSINRELLTVQAIHSDGDAIIYSIDIDSMEVDPSLEGVKNNAFVMNPSTGVITLNIQPTAAMHGMFEFNVHATDTAGSADTAQVRVYMISSQNRVFFTFYNTINQVIENTEFIATTFTTGFNMTCNVDQIVPATNDDGLPQEDYTELRAHFILNDIPVAADVIEEIRGDTQRLRQIQLTLNTRLVVLQDFVTDSTPDIGSDLTLISVYVLAALAALLAFMCFVLLLTYILRTRALKRRLEALSMTKYGSVDSGLNRTGLAAPGTNKHAVEGSNPIWNESIKAPDFDAVSDMSGDSDLIGIEDLPQFAPDYDPQSPASDATHIIADEEKNEPTEPIANHNNNFGYNFNPFANKFNQNNNFN